MSDEEIDPEMRLPKISPMLGVVGALVLSVAATTDTARIFFGKLADTTNAVRELFNNATDQITAGDWRLDEVTRNNTILSFAHAQEFQSQGKIELAIRNIEGIVTVQFPQYQKTHPDSDFQHFLEFAQINYEAFEGVLRKVIASYDDLPDDSPVRTEPGLSREVARLKNLNFQPKIASK